MIKIFLAILLMLSSEKIQAQSSIEGEYYLEGVMETASGFKLMADGHFEFFFSYGALDRQGSGKWRMDGNQVILASQEETPAMFTLVKSEAGDSNFITIKIKEENVIFASAVYAALQTNNIQTNPQKASKGYIKIPWQPADSLVLFFEFAPEKIGRFPIQATGARYMEYSFHPSALDVYFHNIRLKITDNGLSGQHPLLKEGVYQFIKRK